MARSEEFLNLYRQLEELLRNRYAGKRLQNSSPFFQFLNERESQPFKDDLNACREMRNILSHCTDIHGDPPLEPSEGAITLLREVVEYLKQPPRALDY
ncbi:MAG: hypothetical protein RSA27_06720, partial [Oscillospiraceae bacterium]